jgi:hypothetical protein
VGIFGRITARQRLRRATLESFSVPTFSAPLDCTPWVVGGLWPTELSANSAGTATLAEHLKVDLQRIATSANEDLRAIGRTGMVYPVRRDAEARVIDEARALAVRRVESTMRQLRQMRQHTPALRSADMERTQVLPAVRDELPAFDRADLDKTQVLSRVRNDPALADLAPGAPEDPAETETETDGDQRLSQLLAFVARQEPRLSWAVGERPDGSTVLVTDLAHGWIPPGIAVPDGVVLLAPERRTGRTRELLGDTMRTATYVPGDSANWVPDLSGTKSSPDPFELPAVEDLGWKLGVATHWREGLPRLVNTLAKAAAAGADIVEQEADLLRVHLDTARYQILAQYPEVDSEHLLNCMLLAATAGSVVADSTSANYHFAWFEKLDADAVGNLAETSPASTS